MKGDTKHYMNICQTCEQSFMCEHKHDFRCPYCRIAELEEQVVDLGLERTKLLRFIGRNEGAEAVQALLGKES